MRTFWTLTRYSRSCPSGLLLAAALVLGGCATTGISPAQDGHRARFLAGLAGDPPACQDYRQAYVEGFRQNVAALSADDSAAQANAAEALRLARSRLQEAGLNEGECSRPYCIIEPLQNGRLDSWCGYRLDADSGDDLYQWLDWPSVQAALKR